MQALAAWESLPHRLIVAAVALSTCAATALPALKSSTIRALPARTAFGSVPAVPMARAPGTTGRRWCGGVIAGPPVAVMPGMGVENLSAGVPRQVFRQTAAIPHLLPVHK